MKYIKYTRYTIMHTVTAKLPDDLFERLQKLGEIVDRNKSYLVRKALEAFLDEREDYFIALHRLEQKNPRISLAELDKE